MRRHLRRSSALVVSGVLVAAGVALSAPASAAGPSGSLVYGAVDGDFTLHLHTLDLTTKVDSVLPGSDLANSRDPFTTVSPDGTRIAVRSDNPMDFGDSVDVFDTTTSTWAHLLHATDNSLGAPVWIPGTQSLLVGIPDFPEGGGALWVVNLDGTRTQVPGTHSTGASGIAAYAVSPSGKQIVYTQVTGYDTAQKRAPRDVFVMNVDGTSPRALGVTGDVVGWFHDGSRVLLSNNLYNSAGTRAGTVLSTITPRGGALTPLPLTYTATTMLDTAISPDDAWLTVEPETVQDTFSTHVTIVPVDGSAAPVTVIPDAEVIYGASFAGAWTASDSTAPTMTDVTATLGATSATLSWPSVAALDTVGVQVAVSPGLTPPATYSAGTYRSTALGVTKSATFGGLLAGATYSYSAWALDGSGNASTPVTGHFRLIPAATLTAPALASTASSTGVPVTYRGGGGGTAGIQIDVAYSTFQQGTAFSCCSGLPVPGTAGTFVFDKSVYPYLPAGAMMRFRAGAVDAYGNVRWSAAVSSVVPFDDRDTALKYSGTWSKPAAAGAWLGTTSVTRTGGSVSLFVRRMGTRAPSAKRFSVVATVSPTSGRFKVYVDGRYVTTVSTRSSSTGLRRTVWTSASLSAASHRITLVQVTGSGWLRLDGIGVTHRS